MTLNVIEGHSFGKSVGLYNIGALKISTIIKYVTWYTGTSAVVGQNGKLM